MSDISHPHPPHTVRPGIGASLSNVATEAMNLFRGETALVRAEAKMIMGQIAGALVMAVVGTALIMAALVIVLSAVVAALVAAGLSPALSAAIVGGLAVALGALLVNAARTQLTSEAVVPSTSIKQLSRDADVLKDISK